MGAAKKYDPEIAKEIQKMTQYGAPLVPDVCELVGLSEKTIRKLYHAELARGRAIANIAVGKKLFERCMAGDVVALIFWAKTRMKWREKDRDADNACNEENLKRLKEALREAYHSVG